ncbi:hypothetical protein AB0B25_29855 [Nocardia sp. NPDC049190]|uniref:hypothetical protein n=1 Tax=Nocardia sp. NPDC049190 TaxID=3155650 RepID=UPI0033E1A876
MNRSTISIDSSIGDIERLLKEVSPALQSSIRRQMASSLHAAPAAFQAFIDYQ